MRAFSVKMKPFWTYDTTCELPQTWQGGALHCLASLCLGAISQPPEKCLTFSRSPEWIRFCQEIRQRKPLSLQDPAQLHLFCYTALTVFVLETTSTDGLGLACSQTTKGSNGLICRVIREPSTSPQGEKPDIWPLIRQAYQAEYPPLAILIVGDEDSWLALPNLLSKPGSEYALYQSSNDSEYVIFGRGK